MGPILSLVLVSGLAACGGALPAAADAAPASAADAAPAAAADAAPAAAADAAPAAAADAAPADETAVVTPVGADHGPPAARTIEVGGGTASEPTTGAEVAVPAGSFDGATDVILQPVANTLPGGLGDGIAIATSRPQTGPILVRFSYGEDVGNPALLLLATQDDDGSWRALFPVRVNPATHTVSAALEPAPAAAKPQGTRPRTVVKYLGFFMKPAKGTVRTGGSLALTPYARVSEAVCDVRICLSDIDCLENICREPVVSERPFTNDKDGFSRSWQVNVGTIQPGGGAGATYTAPEARPDPAVAHVVFTSTRASTGQTVSIRAEVTISPDEYTVTLEIMDRGDLLSCGPAQVTLEYDFAGFTLTAGDGDSLTADAFVNQDAMVAPPAFPIPDCELVVDLASDWMNVTGAGAVTVGDELRLDVDFTTTYGACSLQCGGNLVQAYPTTLSARGLHVMVPVGTLRRGDTVTVHDAVWNHTIDVTKL